MSRPGSIAAAVVAAALVATSCATARSSASSSGDQAPPPTIGLGTNLADGVDPAIVSGAADVRAIGAEQIDSIVMIGDSITVAAEPALRSRFAVVGFDDPLILAEERKRMTEQIRDNPSGAAIATFLTGDDEPGEDHANELWIVALGTNDIGQYDLAEIAVAVDRVLDEVPPGAPLVWVDTYWRGRPDDTAEMNAIIADRVERRGNGVVAAWSFFAGGDGVMRSDGVHPSAEGADVFAAVVVETAARFLGR